MRVRLLAGAWIVLGAGVSGAQEQREDTLSRVVRLPEVVVSTARAHDRTPVARSVLNRQEIQARNWGQDTPMALATLPGAYAYSDAGNGIGYSYLSIRGFPQRRISVLINGVPLNDPESHEVYWIDHPDLLASTVEAQVQRGVGSALYGAASIAGSVNLETSPFTESSRASLSLGYGSFNTRRLAVEAGSGRLEGDWNLYGRYSRIETDGYRDRSDSDLWSYAFSARKAAGAHTLRAHLYGGPEETHLAYLGVPREVLEGGLTGDRERDRRFNPILYEEERDHFFEPHYELMHAWTISPDLALTQTLFYFDGEGYYDEQRFAESLASYRLSPWATTDSTLFPRDHYRQDSTGALVEDGSGRFTVDDFDGVRRRWIKNRHYGWIPRLQLEHGAGALTVGGEIRGHDGRHVGSVLAGSGLPPGTAPDHVYYDYHPRTLSAGLFAREEWRLRPALQVTADIGWRHQGYAMRGDRFDGIRFDQPYDFALPRLGVTWTPRSELTVFGAWARSRREPAFRDLYDAEGVGSVPLFVDGEPILRPETVNDWELGGAWRGSAWSLTTHLFRMDFEDELVFGTFNTDLGYAFIGNAARSVHQGIELAGRAEIEPARGLAVVLDANTTLSDNHFVEYREPDGSAVYDDNTIGFFPSVIANASARVGLGRAAVGLEAQHAGRIYLDHTESRASSIDPRTVFHLHGTYGLGLAREARLQLGVRVFNLFDEEYETGGYTYAGVPYFIPAATRHALAELRMDF